MSEPAAPSENLPALVRGLRDPGCYDHPADDIRVLETHISYVLLTGPYAYKIKKPVTLPFLDFSTLQFRKHYCDEELRINRRLAAEIYLDVVPITGTPSSPRVGGEGAPIEYAVRMIQFDDADRLDRVAGRDALTPNMIDDLADTIADFHGRVAVAEPGSEFADSGHLRREVMENFDVLRPLTLPGELSDELQEIRRWSAHSLVELGAGFRARKNQGWVRECHGDMHLANMTLHDGRVTIFDALEFNENYRWIDVQSELAFVLMDLDYRGHAGLGWQLLSRYLGETGDYGGLRVLRHYRVYRSMVRAKVAGLRAQQCVPGNADHEAALAELVAHVALAQSYVESDAGAPLVITCGVSGSGKSWLSERLMRVLGAVRIRSDVERQRLARDGRLRPGALYDAGSVNETYEELAGLARSIITCGYPAIVDATFLARAHRERFLALARELGVPFTILALDAPQEVLEARVAERRSRGDDPSEATAEVLARQRASLDPLNEEERESAITITPAAADDAAGIARRILRTRSAPLARRLDAPGRERR